MYLVENGQGSDELITVVDRSVKRRVAVPRHDCVDRSSFPRGTAISATAVDGVPAHGFLFVPAARPPKGLILELHGGPRTAHVNLLTSTIVRAWLERGYAVAAVNYRGGTGYGRALLEKPYGGGLDGMLHDVDAIRRASLEKLGQRPTLPVVIHGVSYGGFLAIKAGVESDQAYRAVIVDSAVCRLKSSVDNVGYAGESLSNVSVPDYSLHKLRLATNPDGKVRDVDLCNKRIGGDAKVIVVHAEGDPIAPYPPIRTFIDAQAPKRLMKVISNGATHDPIGDFAADPKFIATAADAILKFIEDPVDRN
jgi:hypothetical protein